MSDDFNECKGGEGRSNEEIFTTGEFLIAFGAMLAAGNHRIGPKIAVLGYILLARFFR